MTRPILSRPAMTWPAAARLAAVSLLALGLGACRTIPPVDADLEQARVAVNAAASNPEVARGAGVELERARQALARADALWRERDAEASHHWSYLARQRASIAQATANQARDEERLRSASTERERVRLEARTREADAARQQAANAQATAANAQASAADARQQTQQMRDAAAQAAARNAELERDLQQLQGRKTDRGMVVTLGDVLFDTGRAVLKPGALRNLERLAAVLQQYPERRVMIEGFTDNVGSETANLQLSQRRAEAFAQALIGRGIAAQRIEVRAYGEGYPVADNATAAGRQLNRRVEVLFSDAQGGFATR